MPAEAGAPNFTGIPTGGGANGHPILCYICDGKKGQ
jgi:hypothetical protein